MQTQKLSTEMVRTPHEGPSRCAELGTQSRMVGTPYNSHKCADLGTQCMNRGKPSK